MTHGEIIDSVRNVYRISMTAPFFEGGGEASYHTLKTVFVLEEKKD